MEEDYKGGSVPQKDIWNYHRDHPDQHKLCRNAAKTAWEADCLRQLFTGGVWSVSVDYGICCPFCQRDKDKDTKKSIH